MLTANAEIFLGIDGCRTGWCVAALGASGGWKMRICKNIDEIVVHFGFIRQALIDIPTGLPWEHPRTSDQLARQLLKPRGASIFRTPCRQVLAADDYVTASQINLQILGQKIFRQTWSILLKIKQVDAFFAQNPPARNYLRESHPECCFWAFNPRQNLQFSKKQDLGLQERLQLLEKINPVIVTIFNQALSQFSRHRAARDDIVDALELAVTAGLDAHSVVSIPPQPEFDQTGLPMEIVMPNPNFKKQCS
jgi:predicted RNase H-like nuclease